MTETHQATGTRSAAGFRPRFRPLPARVDLPALELDVLRRWHDDDIFARSLRRTEDGPLWVFYEGPPYANGTPGVHHVEARVFKDVFPRFKTMKGFHVPRKAGWDCHGLPVEVAVEKELGFSGKRDIEAYGVAEFNARCRESVMRHVDAFEDMTERMGYWVDMSKAYRTMDASYVEAVWWSLKRVFDKGLLVEDHRITPYCPRCGTGLSDHEMGQEDVYQTVTDPSVYVRLPITSGPLAGEADLLVWTTTPWTLVSNTAVAVHPDVTYVVARRPGEGKALVVAEQLVERALGEGWTIERRIQGRELERTTYRRPFDLVAFPKGPDKQSPNAHYVVLGDYVTVEDGTGLVHEAPAFGADDLATCRAYGLPVVNPIRGDGTFAPEVPLVGGEFFKDADKKLTASLEERGLLFRHETYEHSYPHCWRCGTPLLYYALPSWYIRTTAVKERLLEENERTNWYPATIKHGRYGDWLRNNVDWALSRNRYWGTPLPVWRCEQEHLTCVGSLAELSELAGHDLSDLDPHRPYVDEVSLPCPDCGGEARRVPEVIDVWYDSGSMPFAQWGYPHQGAETFRERYPAQFICEALDQTRGWFYSLMAIGTLVFDRSSYENVLCLGIILAEDGRKMSKHLGNVLEPLPLMERHGADALRWFMLASGSPWASRRVGHAALDEIVRKILLTYWNTASFLTLYARTSGWLPGHADAPAYADRPLLDRWLLSELHRSVSEVDAALERYDTARAGRRLSDFVDDLSNWYVRRSRRRFWEGDTAALSTLYETVETLTRLLAPFVPFVTDGVWQAIAADVDAGAPRSVHLASWPTPREQLVDPELSRTMALARRLVELGRTARASSAVRTRQPLPRALVPARGFAELPEELRAVIADELNVQALEPLTEVSGDLVDYTVKPNFRILGRRFGRRTPAVADAVTAADPRGLTTAVREGEATVRVDGEEVTLGADEVIVTETPRTGWAVASGAGETVALDLDITPELRRSGRAREVVRLVQEARKSSGLDVADRIALWWETDDSETAAAMRGLETTIAGEVLATSYTEGKPDADLPVHRGDDLSVRFWLRRA
ncbi:MAG: isoleucine--tRNA ligase [Streptosporangiaceae bacterium]